VDFNDLYSTFDRKCGERMTGFLVADTHAFGAEGTDLRAAFTSLVMLLPEPNCSFISVAENQLRVAQWLAAFAPHWALRTTPMHGYELVYSAAFRERRFVIADAKRKVEK
jgi:hypothetical protein